MGSTRTLQSSIAFTRPFLGGQYLLVGGLEPGLTASNLVKQTILGPPFVWPFNRSEITITLVVGQQDYPVFAASFGFVESWLLTDPVTGEVKEIENKGRLTKESATDRPASAAVQTNDNSGNLLVRLNNLPDKAYTLTLTYQRQPPPMLSPASTWAPLPDYYSYIYDWGFLAIASLLIRDDRFPVFRQMFMAHLLGAQDGLDETARNIFLGTFLDNMKMTERASQFTQLAGGGRQF
jgi:hypothetical protein